MARDQAVAFYSDEQPVCELDELASGGDEYGASAEADDETPDGMIDFDAL